MDERDRADAYQAYLDDLNACHGCLHDRNGCTHPQRETWQRRNERGHLVLTVCGACYVEDAAEKVAAQAWDDIPF